MGNKTSRAKSDAKQSVIRRPYVQTSSQISCQAGQANVQQPRKPAGMNSNVQDQASELAYWNRLRNAEEQRNRQARAVQGRATVEGREERGCGGQERVVSEVKDNAGPRQKATATLQARRQPTEQTEGAVGYAQAGPPLPGQMPEVCNRHNSFQGCKNATCRRLHICKHFLADICKYGVTCHSCHSLTTVHNQMVCDLYNLNTKEQPDVIQKLRHAMEDEGQFPDSMYLNHLEICFKFGSANPCKGTSCNRIHICRKFVTGSCGRTVCKFGHDLHSVHNNGVLSRHKLNKMSDDIIMDILLSRPTRPIKRQPPKAVRNGAAARQQSDKAVSHGQKADDLSEELQCPICLEMFNRATTLGCGHTFCAGCVDSVRGQGGDNNCPTCRARITSCTRSVTLDNIIKSVPAK